MLEKDALRVSRFAALIDACALVPLIQADLLLRLAEKGIFRPLWSKEILEEVVYAVESVHPELKENHAARNRVRRMNEFFPDAETQVLAEIENALCLPDQDDRHVLAAAIFGRADLIITNNVKDFPAEYVEKFNIQVQIPDEFLTHQLDLSPQKTIHALQELVNATKKPQLSFGDVLKALERCGNKNFAKMVETQQWRAAI